MTASDSFREKRLKVNPAFVPVCVTENEIHFRGGTWNKSGFRIRDDSESGALAALLERLRAGETVGAIVDQFDPAVRTEIEQTIRNLFQRSVLVEATETSPEKDAYTGYLSVKTDPETAADATARSVVVIGSDRLAEMILADLAEMGISDLRIVDPAEQVDVPADAARLSDGAAADEAFQDADLLVATATAPQESKFIDVNERALQAGTPLLVARIHGLDGMVGPTILPGETACFECLRQRTRTSAAAPDSLSAYVDAGDAGLAATPFVRVIAGHATTEILHQLSNEIGFTLGRMLSIDFYDLSIDTDEVLKLPRCPACGPTKPPEQRFATIDRVIEERGLSEHED